MNEYDKAYRVIWMGDCNFLNNGKIYRSIEECGLAQDEHIELMWTQKEKEYKAEYQIVEYNLKPTGYTI